jgi:hypothetical protein
MEKGWCFHFVLVCTAMFSGEKKEYLDSHVIRSGDGEQGGARF